MVIGVWSSGLLYLDKIFWLNRLSFEALDQRAKKVVSDSPGLVDFAIGLVNSVFNLPDGQVMFFFDKFE